jgi:outer membrane biosynthesis protein TonB
VRLLLISLLVATFALAACGGDDRGQGIPQNTASSLLSELAAVQNRLDQGSVGACEDVIDESVPAIQKKLDSLPEKTDSELRTALEDSFTKLRTLSEQTCDDRRQKAEDKKKTTTTETTPPPTTTETEPPPTTTTETTPPTTETTPKPKPAPKPKDNGNGNGKKNDSGGGGGAKAPSTGNGGGTALPVDPE